VPVLYVSRDWLSKSVLFCGNVSSSESAGVCSVQLMTFDARSFGLWHVSISKSDMLLPCFGRFSFSGMVTSDPVVSVAVSSSLAGVCLLSSDERPLPSFVKTDDSYNVLTTLRNLTKLKSLLSVICVNSQWSGEISVLKFQRK
jgi:hypothetical protein